MLLEHVAANAVARYEPMRQVINLTKMRGAGSLAHGDGMDWMIIGQKLGVKGFLSEAPISIRYFKVD